MPLPTDKPRVNRTFRQAATDPLDTNYHVQGFAVVGGTAALEIYRGHEAIACRLTVPRALAGRVLEDPPHVHGGLRARDAAGVLVWTYDHYGDQVFSALKSGAYRNRDGKEWSVAEVLADSIDEVRAALTRACGEPAGQTAPLPRRAEAISVGAGTRRLLRPN